LSTLVEELGPVMAVGLRFADRVGKALRDAPRDAVISLSAQRKRPPMNADNHR
jgi:hypothetical protein